MNKLAILFLPLVLCLPAYGAAPQAQPQLCSQDHPLAQLDEPLVPNRDPSKEKFDSQCTNVRTNQEAEETKGSCDATYLSIHSELRTIRSAYKSACQTITARSASCSGDQSVACARDMHREAQQQLQTVATEQRTASEALAARMRMHLQAVKAQLPRDLTSSNVPEAEQAKLQEQVSGLVRQIQSEAPPAANTDRRRFLQTCQTQLKVGATCEHLAIAAEAKYYIAKLKAASIASQNSSIQAGELSTHLSDQKEKQGSVRSGIGTPSLQDMIGLATIGVIGTTAFCSITGKCSKQNSSSGGNDPNGSGITAPTDAGGTSPTPTTNNNASNGADSGTSLGTGNSGNDGNGSIANSATDNASRLGVVDPTALGKNEGGDAPSFSSGAGGGTTSGSLPFPLQSHADRSPSSMGSAGGGLGSSGSGNSDGLGSSSQSADASASAAKDSAKSNDNTYGSAGGTPSSGFSLGGSGSSSSADNALKSILNGDIPPNSDSSLAAFSTSTDSSTTTGTGTTQASAGDPLLDDKQSIFYRVRDTHQRCLKRGCVSIESGGHI